MKSLWWTKHNTSSTEKAHYVRLRLRLRELCGKPPLSHAISLRDTGRHQQELIGQKDSGSHLKYLTKISFAL